MRVNLGSVDIDDETRESMAYGMGMEEGHLASREEIRLFYRIAANAKLEADAEERHPFGDWKH